MFGMFGSGKVKAECLGDTLGPMQTYAGLNLNELSNKENFDLQEEAINYSKTQLVNKKNI